MSLSGMDLTFFDAEKEQDSIKVFRKTTEFKIKREKGFVIIKNKINDDKRIPEKIFDQKFTHYPGSSDPESFCIEPPVCYAVEMGCLFYIIDCETLEKTKGQRGDFVVTRESGINEVIKKEDIFKKFFANIDNELNYDEDNILSI